MQATINTNNATAQINPDELTLQFHTEYGNPIKYYDDGMGGLWLYRDADGLIGIVRCQSESDAWDIVCDEFLWEVPQEDIPNAYDAWDRLYDGLQARGHEPTPKLREAVSRHYRAYFRLLAANDELTESGGLELIEGYEYAPNGPRETGGSGIRSRCLNGEALEPLSVELLDRLSIRMSVTME